MAVDIASLSAADFLSLLYYQGSPPPGPEFDAIRTTAQEWAELFPAAAVPPEGEEADAGDPPAAPAPH
jgi:hypothetical protein